MLGKGAVRPNRNFGGIPVFKMRLVGLLLVVLFVAACGSSVRPITKDQVRATGDALNEKLSNRSTVLAQTIVPTATPLPTVTPTPIAIDRSKGVVNALNSLYKVVPSGEDAVVVVNQSGYLRAVGYLTVRGKLSTSCLSQYFPGNDTSIYQLDRAAWNRVAEVFPEVDGGELTKLTWDNCLF